MKSLAAPSVSTTATAALAIGTQSTDHVQRNVQQRVDDGWLSYLEGRWLAAWLEHLDRAPDGPVRAVATHSDVQISNILVNTDSLRYEVSQLGVEVVEVQPSAYPTNFFTDIQTPADTEVTKSYGEVGQIPDAMFESFTSRFAGEDAPNPHDIAEAVAKLVGQPKGSRATRTVVGAAFGSDKANEDIAPVQAKVVEYLGLSHLEKIA